MKRRIATAVAIIGAVVVGNHLASVWPRNVELAYALDPGIDELDVDFIQDGEAVASARFTQPEEKSALIRHTVRLQPGEYEARITVYRPDGPAVEHQRVLLVPAKGLTRFDLKEATKQSK
jgi:hypothetical protein